MKRPHELDQGRAASESIEAMDVRMDVVIGYVLLVGAVLSAALIVAALVWHWSRTGHLGTEYLIARLNLFEFLTEDIRRLVTDPLRPRLLLNLGIVTLLLTPYVRVLASLLFFVFVERNWKYSVFTGFVLSVLTYSLFLR